MSASPIRRADEGDAGDECAAGHPGDGGHQGDGGPERARVSVVIYSRAGCHLCEDMKAEMDLAGCAELFTLSEIDIDSDPALRERFDRSIPVLEIAGRVALKGRWTAVEFRRKLERALRA